MKLTEDNVSAIKYFFNYHNSLSDTFINFYNFALSHITNLVFDTGDGRIIGFKKPGERFIVYIYKQQGHFMIRYNKQNIYHDFDFSVKTIEDIKKDLFGHVPNDDKKISVQKEKPLNVDISGDFLDGFDYELSALEKEKQNAKINYQIIKDEIIDIEKKLPYPNVGPFDTGIDYDDISNVQYKKNANKKFWDLLDELGYYYNLSSLYVGHLSCTHTDYYLMDHPGAQSKLISNKNNSVLLISSDDSTYDSIFSKWKFPKKEEDILFSRNIEMVNKEIINVDIVYDKSNELYSNIQDLFLRNALKKNKTKANIQSIIQTIQEKQNEIRVCDTHESFVVQGCAGSGKTMVLLHRLRYLQYNNFIRSSSYFLLLPNNSFKSYLAKVSREFNVYEDNMLSYTDYYKSLLSDKNQTVEEKDETVFSEEYLTTVYSESFIKECFNRLFDTVKKTIETLIDCCDEKLTDLLEEEKSDLIKENENKIADATKYLEKLLSPIIDLMDKKVLKDLSNVALVLDNINTILLKLKAEYDEKMAILNNYVVDESIFNEAFSQDENLARFNNDIIEQENRLLKASFFTKRSHQKRLNALKEKYELELQSAKEKIITIEKEKKKIELFGDNTHNSGVTISDLEQIIEQAEVVNDKINRIKKNNDDILNMEEAINSDFSVKWKKEIHLLQSLIEYSGELDLRSIAKEFEPAKQSLFDYINQAKELHDAFSAHFIEDKRFRDNFKLLQQKSSADLESYLYRTIFDGCKKYLKEHFDYIPSKQYKHYWYLALYFTYLIKGQMATKRNYIYIDEAQDLSVSELSLIYKVNNNAVMNLFGDTNQGIYKHGIKRWEDLSFIKKKYVLDENFRNTNAVVEYCNKNLPFFMNPVGVEMEQVDIYKNIEEVIDLLSNNSGIVFIVKDEYAEQDLVELLNNFQLNNFTIYSVKKAKGLEFKEVYVFDAQMTENEKYISYTRALIKLNIIKSLPKSDRRSKIEVIQEDDFEN